MTNHTATPKIVSKVAPKAAPSAISSPAMGARFAPKDFIELLAGAVASGLAVSLVAVGIALALAGSAGAAPAFAPVVVTSIPVIEAKKFVDPQLRTSVATVMNSDTHAVPGSLRVGGGCDSEPINAIEREWIVSVDGSTAKVRVMQSFIMPRDGGTAAFFDTVLPTNAKLIGLTVDALQQRWEGRVVTAGSMAKLGRNDIHTIDGVDKKDVVPMWIDAGYVTTDQLVNLMPGETIVVEYTYVIAIAHEQGGGAFSLNIASGEAHADDASTRHKPAPVSGTVWVDFIGALPTQLKRKHSAVVIEDSPVGIRGISWFSAALDRAETFSIAWEMPTTKVNAPRAMSR